MKLLELFKAIKDENLQKDQLESYHKSITELYADMHLQLGEIKKKKGLFMLKNPEMTGVAIMREWNGNLDGQREIELKSYIKATSAQLSSLRSRLYANY